MSLATMNAMKQMRDNLQNHLTPQGNPVEWSISKALMNIAEAIGRLEADVAELKARVQRLQ